MESARRSVTLVGRKWVWTGNADVAWKHLDGRELICPSLHPAYSWTGIKLEKPLKEKVSGSANIWGLTEYLTHLGALVKCCGFIKAINKSEWLIVPVELPGHVLHPHEAQQGRLGGEDALSCGAFKKGTCVLAPVAFWANYSGLCVMKHDGVKDQDKSGILSSTFGVFETEKKRFGVPAFLISLVSHLSS